MVCWAVNLRPPFLLFVCCSLNTLADTTNSGAGMGLPQILRKFVAALISRVVTSS